MLKAILLPIVCVSMLGGTAAVAADLEAMSRNQREIYCVANGWIDIGTRLDAGLMSDQEYNRIRNQLVGEIQDKGDNYNYASDFRRVEATIDEIIEARPDMREIASSAEQCRLTRTLRIPNYP